MEIEDLRTIRDERGLLVELHRHREELPGPVQWNVIVSERNTMRGLHLHLRHTDWITAVAGEVVVALVDLRAGGGGPAATVTLSADRPQVIVIPPGVLHGLFTPERSTILNGLSHRYDPDDDLEARFDDPALGLDWPLTGLVLSARDRGAPTVAQLVSSLSERGITFPGPGD